MINPTQINALKKAFITLDLKTTYTYSGRGMYGELCFGFTCNHAPSALLQFVSTLLSDLTLERHDVITIIDELGSPRTDNMGLQTIVYFPSFHLDQEHCYNVNEMNELFNKVKTRNYADIATKDLTANQLDDIYILMCDEADELDVETFFDNDLYKMQVLAEHF